jgi:hypothetical protein
MTRALGGIVLVALWLGAALLTVAVVAPGAFAVLPTRTLAGAMVGRVLPTVFGGAIVVPGVVLWLTPLARRSRLAWSASVVAMLASLAAILVVNPRIAAVRAAVVVPIDQLPPHDARRALFGALHGVSVALLGAAMLAIVLLLAVLARATVAASSPPDTR